MPWTLDYTGTGVGKSENGEDIDNEELQAAFEKWKSKTYALTVPLRVVSLSNSFPPVWLKVCYSARYLTFLLSGYDHFRPCVV